MDGQPLFTLLQYRQERMWDQSYLGWSRQKRSSCGLSVRTPDGRTFSTLAASTHIYSVNAALRTSTAHSLHTKMLIKTKLLSHLVPASTRHRLQIECQMTHPGLGSVTLPTQADEGASKHGRIPTATTQPLQITAERQHSNVTGQLFSQLPLQPLDSNRVLNARLLMNLVSHHQYLAILWKRSEFLHPLVELLLLQSLLHHRLHHR